MTLRLAAWCLATAVIPGLLPAQSDPASIRPVRGQPVERHVLNLKFRDWGAAAIADGVVLAGNATGGGGLHALDIASGKRLWSFVPVFPGGPPGVATKPVVAGDVVIAPFGMPHAGAVIAVSLKSGKELWRLQAPLLKAGVAVSNGLAYILSDDGHLYAVEVASGRPQWRYPLATDRAPCSCTPVVRDDTVYLSVNLPVPAADRRPSSYHLIAVDARTGEERWRYKGEAPYVHSGVCLGQPVVTEDAVLAYGESRLYAVDRATGRNRYPPVELQRTDGFRAQPVQISGLAQAGPLVIGVAADAVVAFEWATGRVAWEVPGEYNPNQPSLAVAGDVLYFQGSPRPRPAATPTGTLHALDLRSREILWSHTRTTNAGWSFGTTHPVDGGLWVDHYGVLIKLEEAAPGR